MPYLYTAMRNACRDSVPMLRPIYLEYPEPEESYRNMQEFFCGDALLAAPITSLGAGSRHLAFQIVHVPEGEYCHFFTGVSYGAGTFAVPADLNEMPLLVRSGFPLVLGSAEKKHLADPDTDFEIQLFPPSSEQTHTFVLYEDDGVSNLWEKGEFAETTVTAVSSPERATVKIAPSVGSYDAMTDRRSFSFCIRNVSSATKCLLNGKCVPFRLEDDTLYAGPFQTGRRTALILEVRFLREPDFAIRRGTAERYLRENPGQINEALLTGGGVLKRTDPLSGVESLMVWPQGLQEAVLSDMHAYFEHAGNMPISFSIPTTGADFYYQNGASFSFNRL